MKQYLELLQDLLDNAVQKGDRTGTGTISTFGRQLRWDLSKGFPLMTTKKMPLRVIFEELKWFLDGETNIRQLLDKNVNIWTPDAYREYLSVGGTKSQEEYVELIKSDGMFAALSGDLGPIYGKQWRTWMTDEGTTIDQIKNAIELIKTDPDSRRNIVSAWNVADLPYMALPPCHYAFQFYVVNGKVSCMFHMRSVDTFLGLPFNIASYALLTHMIAQVTGLEVGDLVWTGGDVHVYNNHIDQIKEQLTREPKPLPTLRLNPDIDDIFGFTWEDITLENYEAHPHIAGKVSV